ncbi:hypothetical protein [Clostridium frigidicarnis]|uniref:SbsC C-terminal domain-containing protein n=1 Tax=Clostridium frigidicarnis TaxID=84698 RepID=A0A1I0VYC3_9CLOT|nr:hypothetical protein [Clostridium frigidicarnis]SFA81057.1 hypothetical protein SAMN04488528_1003105 [Clostridium frigidicarnis]
MKNIQKKFIGAVLAASSVVGIVAPSVTAMATVVDDEQSATAEDLKNVISEYTAKLEDNTIFANYHRVQYAAERLAQYDEDASQEALANIAKYADTVFTEEVKTILDKMDGFATSKSMASYDELVNKDIPSMKDAENANYLMSRLDVWGKAVVFEVDPNYVKATDAILEVANLIDDGEYDKAENQVVVAKAAIKAIETYEVNGAYLEGKLKIEEDILVEKANLKVVSAEAINAKEIKVVFNREVDEDSAEAQNNYKIYVGGDATGNKVTSFASSLQDDNKTVILQISDNDENYTKLENGQSYKVEAKDIIGVDGKKLETYSGSFAIFNDNTAPSLVNTEYTGSTVKFTFDEPLNRESLPTVKIDNTTISYDTTNAFSEDAGEYELTVSLSGYDKAQEYGDHTVKISGATDYSDNTADILTTKYTATEDNEKPVVTSIEEDSQNRFIVKFNTEVKNFDKDNLEVKKGNHKFENVELVESNPKNNEFTFEVSDDDGNALYEDDENSVQLSVKVKDYTGTNDVFGDDVTSKATLNRDETAPEVNEALNRVENNKTLVVYFDKDLKTVNEGKISIVRDGVREYVNTAEVNGKRLEITLKESSLDDSIKTLETGTYNITLEKGTVLDKADNKNEATSTSINYTNDEAEEYVLADGAITVEADENINKNVITVNFGTKMTSSALDLSNYTVDGVKLSDSMYAGTTVAFTSSTNKSDVEITLSRGTVEVTGNKSVKLSKKLTTDKGEYVTIGSDKEYKEDVEFFDDTNPEVSKTEFITSNSGDTTTKILRVTFTEEVTSNDASLDDLKDDFVVKDSSGNKISIENIAVDADNQDTIVIKLAKDVSVNKTITVGVTDDKTDNPSGINVFDTSANLVNELETGKSTVSGKEVNKDVFNFFE